MFTATAAYSVEFLPMFDKEKYSVGEWPVITIQDSSKNSLPGKIDTIYSTIQSDSEPEEKQLELVETGVNTGIFTGAFQLTSTPGGENTLHAKNGDSIHVLYLSFVKTAAIKESGTNVSPILVSTNKADYKVGEVIVVSGSVTGGDTSYDVELSIVDPHGNTIYTESIDLSYIGSFSTEINTEDTGWTDSGNYKVLIWHKSQETQAEIVFSFSSTYGKQETTDAIKIFNSDVNLDYSITSGKITIVKADTTQNSILFSIDVNSGGHLTVKLPRYIMDAQDEDGDSEYTVLMDYRNAVFVEKSNPNERTLTIPYIHNTRTLEIIGTFLELEPSSPSKSTFIPDWIRNNAEWWSKDLIGDADFVSGIEYLIIQGVIQIPIVPDENNADDVSFVPPWIKDTAGWWANGLISDNDFVSGIKYLVEQGIIQV